jgi:site-specific recombinase XerD
MKRKLESKQAQKADLRFDAPDAWQADPIRAFDAFVQDVAFVALSRRKPALVDSSGRRKRLMPLRATSAKIYRHMWANFVRWMIESKLSLLTLTTADLVAFLEQRDETGRRRLQGATIRRQYLTLWERVYRHLGIEPNPAAQACRDMAMQRRSDLAGRNKETVALSAAQREAFMAALNTAFAGDAGTQAGWKLRRDAAMQAVMLGAGLKVAEAIGLYTENIGEQGKDGTVPLTVSPSAAGGTVPWHDTLLHAFAAPIVLHWAAERRRLAIPGKLLFPASLKGGKLNKSTVYRHARKFFEAAGIDVSRKGGRTLRNTFAAHELVKGQAEEIVGQMLGHRRQRSIETYVNAASRLAKASRKR